MYDAIIISDIHLGSDLCQAKLLEKFLIDIYEGNILTNQIVINGDLFDNLDFRRLKKSHWRILSLIRKLSRQYPIHLIVGNHEACAEIISHLIGTDFLEELVIKSGKKSFLVLHGHQFDKFMNDHPWLTWLGDIIYNILQKIDFSFSLAKMAKHSSKHFLRCVELVEEKAKIYAFINGHDAVICGHLHLAAHKPIGLEYYNTGCWTEIPATYLSIKDGCVELHKIQ